MGRPLRAAVGGLVYHVLNRTNARATLFNTANDYDAFVGIVAEARVEQPLPISTGSQRQEQELRRRLLRRHHLVLPEYNM